MWSEVFINILGAVFALIALAFLIVAIISLVKRKNFFSLNSSTSIVAAASLLTLGFIYAQFMGATTSQRDLDQQVRYDMQKELAVAFDAVSSEITNQYVVLNEMRRIIKTNEVPMNQRLMNMERYRNLMRDPETGEWFYNFSQGDFMKYEDLYYKDYPEFVWLDRKAELANLENAVLKSHSEQAPAYYNLSKSLWRSMAFADDLYLDVGEFQKNYQYQTDKVDELLRMLNVTRFEDNDKSKKEADRLIRQIQRELELNANLMMSIERKMNIALIGDITTNEFAHEGIVIPKLKEIEEEVVADSPNQKPKVDELQENQG
jgi:hypothetical protein